MCGLDMKATSNLIVRLQTQFFVGIFSKWFGLPNHFIFLQCAQALQTNQCEKPNPVYFENKSKLCNGNAAKRTCKTGD